MAADESGNSILKQPEEAASFPYLYRIGAAGSFDGTVADAALVSPVFSVPESGITFLEFDQWICWNYDHFSYGDMRGGALWIEVDGGAWQHVDPGNWYTETMATYSSGTLYIPTVNDGHRGMKFIDAVIESSKNSTWKKI